MLKQKKNPQIDTRHKIDAERTALNRSLTTKAEKYLRWSRHLFYTLGDKPNTLLARKLTPLPYNLALQELRLCNDKLAQNWWYRNSVSFTQNYTLHRTLSAALADKYFRDIPLPKVAYDHIEVMEGDFTEGEIKVAIKSLRPSKAP